MQRKFWWIVLPLTWVESAGRELPGLRKSSLSSEEFVARCIYHVNHAALCMLVERLPLPRLDTHSLLADGPRPRSWRISTWFRSRLGSDVAVHSTLLYLSTLTITLLLQQCQAHQRAKPPCRVQLPRLPSHHHLPIMLPRQDPLLPLPLLQP